MKKWKVTIECEAIFEKEVEIEAHDRKEAEDVARGMAEDMPLVEAAQGESDYLDGYDSVTDTTVTCTAKEA